MLTKKDILDKQLQQVIKTRSTFCERLQEQGARDLAREKDKWIASEKSCLTQFAVEKDIGLKKGAVKQLEQRLRDLVSQNQLKLKKLRDSTLTDFDEFRTQLKKQKEQELADKIKDVDGAMETTAANTENDFREKLRKLSCVHEEEMETLRESWKKDIDLERARFLEEQRRRASEYAEIIDTERQCVYEAFSKAVAAHQCQLNQVKRDHLEAVEESRARLNM